MSVPPEACGWLSMQLRGLNIYAPQSCTDNARTCRRERSEFTALLFCDGSCKPRWSLAGYAAGATFTSKARVSASVS